MSPIRTSFVSGMLSQNKVIRILVRHFYILLLIPLFFYSNPLAEPGISIAGDFPYLDTSHYAANRLWTWIEKGSIDGFEFLPRFPIIGLWHLLSFINVDSALATKVMIVLGFSLSSFSFYFSFLLFFKGKFSDSNIQLKLSAIVGSLFYAYNVWSFNRIHHWYLWIGYSILPLFFVSIFFSFKNPKDWKYILSSIFLWSFASTTPHMTLFFGIILVGTFLGFIFNNLNKKKKQTIQLAIPMLSIILFYSLVNMYWIYPYILASQTQVPTPNYELTEENLRLLSREGNFMNAFRLMAYWLNSDVERPSEQSLSYSLWLYTSFVIPAIAFSALFLKRSIKYALIFSGIALIGILLAMGTQFPFDYFKVVLTIPTLSNLVWLFRDADKWSLLIAFAYSFLIGLFSYKVLSVTTKEKNNHKKRLLIAGLYLFLLTGSIFLSSYPFYKARMDPLKPVLLPTELDRLNAYLSSINADKIYFIPYAQEETQWNKLGRVGSIYQSHSIKPSIESTEYNFLARNYYTYLENSVVENRSKNIGNLIYPLGTSYVIFHNDTWSKSAKSYDPNNINLLNNLYLLEDLKNISNIGFYKIFKTRNADNNDSVTQVNIPSQNIGVLGGLDVMTSLNAIPTFNSLQSTISFLDDIRTNNTNSVMKSFDDLILAGPSSGDEFALSFVDDKYIIEPFDSTNSNDPPKVWSKSRARDPTHAEFHPHLKSLGIENWNFDYGKGLVITKAMGANISIPVAIENQSVKDDSKDNNFDVFMRYLKNQKGGSIKIYLDGKLLKEIDTLDKISNNFVWEKVGSINLTKGKHTLTLENVAGFNAVNIFAIIPPEEINRLRTEGNHLLADKTRVIHILEAESNFYNNKGMDSGSFNYLSDDGSSNDVADDNSNYTNSTFTKTFRGQFKVPINTDLVALQFMSKQDHNAESLYSIKDLEITPAYKKYNVFTSDFERKKVSIPLATLRQFDWMNYDRDIVSTSLETNGSIYGNNSLRVDIKQGDKIGWNIISTDFIPINENAYYNASLDVSAKDVKQLHSRILYFDSNKKEIAKAKDFIVEGKDGTFEDKFNSSILPPLGAKYLKYQILTLSANSKPSSYLLDNVKLEEITYPTLSSKNKFMENSNKNKGLINIKKENYLESELKENSTHYIIQTKPLSVKENYVYNYTMTVEAKNVGAPSAIALFKNSSDVVVNSTRYGNNASNGDVLSLNSGSELYGRLDIVKPSNYIIALRAKTCESCTFLRMNIEGEEHNKNISNVTKSSFFPLKYNSSGLKWLYSNSTYLKQGTYELEIYSDSQTDLDSVLIYSIGNDHVSDHINNKNNETIEDLFRKSNSPPAKISEYKKINPTKHFLNIKNATRPFIISFAESYDPLWTVYTSTNDSNKNRSFKTNSIPLYGVTNGFYVNKTGDYSLVIEYEPQKWFTNGAIISILTLASILIAFLVLKKQKVMTKLCISVTRRISKYYKHKK